MDLAGDGERNGPDSGIAGVTVDLFTAGVDGLLGTNDDVLADTTTTDGDGFYGFGGLIPSQYRVRETDPAGFSSVTANEVIVSLQSGGRCGPYRGSSALRRHA